MTPAAWKGESTSSIAFSMNPRDSRVVSIYDKYLYDPKDLESSDPRRRELARKASQLKLHGRPANNMDANGLRPGTADTSNTRSPQRKSIAFSTNAKSVDGHTASSHHINNSSSHHEPDRDSGAFGLGLGMLGGSDTESDSDSDDERTRPKKTAALDDMKSSKDSHRPESWTDRAVAVGHRPPDNASQNPPSLKLMALKSAKQGGSASGSDSNNSSHDDKPSRLGVQSSFVDRTSRHGSTIGFSGQPIEGSSQPATNANDGSKRLSARTALTKQLGLVTPNPAPLAAPPAAAARGPSPNQRGPQDYFDSRAPYATQAQPPQRNAAPAPIDVNRAQQLGFGQQNGRGQPSPMSGPSTPNSATPLRSPYGSAGMPSPHHPNGPGSMPPNVLQRGPPGPPSPYGQRGPPNGPQQGPNGSMLMQGNGPQRPGQGPPHPSALHAGPPGNFQRGPPGPQGQPGPQSRGPPGPPGPQPRGPAGPNGNFGPSFSDSRGPKRQSLFRRSMAMFGAGPQAGPPGHGPQQAGGPQQKRQSFFRRSMAMLSGHPHPPAQRQMPPPAPASAPMQSPAPRVKGLQDDYEKPDHPRKSQFLGAGGMGAEWDTQGEGAKFWRRFSMAQKNAGSDKLEDGSRAWMASMASGRRKLIVMGTIALVALVGIIVGVIVWREIVSPSGSTSDEPSSVYKANLGSKNGTSGTATTTSKSAKSTITSNSNSNSNYYSRSIADDDSNSNNDVSKHIRRAITHDLTPGLKMRKRHFGRALPVTSPHQQTSLVDID